MQVAKLNFRWEDNTMEATSWGFHKYRELFCDEPNTGIVVIQEKDNGKLSIQGPSEIVPSKEFDDIRDAEEYGETQFKNHLNRLIVSATPAYDITAFARF